MTLGELYNHPLPGTDAGTCYLCGRETAQGWAGPPSDAFTAWSSCGAGAVHCEFCRPLLKTNTFRFYSWLVLPGEQHLANAEGRGLLWRTLLNPPEGPWALYQTNAGQKQGWLGLAQAVNESRTTYRIAVDWLDSPIMMQAAYVAANAPVIDALRGAEVTKDSLKSGQWSMRDYQRAAGADLHGAYAQAYTQAGNPQWEVLVNAHYRTA
ncbi:MAG: hypothetical protein ABFE07_08375 [Armatimonadia bacterium]